MRFQAFTVVIVLISLFNQANAAVTHSSSTEGEPCEFPDGAVGRCEKATLCLASKGVLKRDGSIVRCKGGGSAGVVICCRHPHLVAHKLCSAWAKYWLKMTPDENGNCSSSKPLIHGGEESGLGEFPNMAALGRREGSSVTFFCGGSLITPSFVLTAAHCLRERDLFVSLGDHDLSTALTGTTARLNEGMPEGLAGAVTTGEDVTSAPVEQWIEVAEIFLYPEYQKIYHDIALLRLKSPAVLTARVLPACLPIQIADAYSAESVFTVIGWGNTHFESPLVGPHGSRKLQKVNIEHIESTLCSYNFTNLPLGITSDFICAASLGKDSCQGDSGGPLMEKAPLRFDAGFCQPQMVVGVVSIGAQGKCPGVGAYTRVESYIDWITGMVAPKVLPE